MTKKRKGDRFRLIIYERMWQRWAWPCVLIILASFALWWFAPRSSIVRTTPRSFRLLTLVPALAAGALLVYSLLARHLAWVQCRPRHLRIRTPFYPLAVSYGRIENVRPQEFHQVFDPKEEKPARRRWLMPYWRKTTLVLDLTGYPLSKAWLRLWLSPYLLKPNSPGLVLLVEDWMALSRRLDERRNAWEKYRAKLRRQRKSNRGLI